MSSLFHGLLLVGSLALGADPLEVPPDVAEIQRKVQQGITPTAAELARLRAWAADAAKNRPSAPTKEQLGSQVVPGADRGPSRASPFFDTTLTVTQTTEAVSKCDDEGKSARLTNTLKGTFKVRLRTAAPKGPISFTGQPPGSGPWRLMLLDETGAEVSSQSVGVDCDGNATSGAPPVGMVHLPMTELVFGAAERPLVNNVLLQPSPDQAHPQSPWGAPAYPPSFRQAALAATFTLDGEALRKMLLDRDLKPVSGTHTSVMKADGGTTVTTTVFAFGPEKRDPKFKVLFVDATDRESPEEWKKWVPVPWLEKEADARALGLPVKDDTVRARALIKLSEGARAKLTVRLRDVSQYPGFVGNYPKTGADQRPDLKLLAPKNDPGWKIAADGQSATLEQAVDRARIDVVALDPAAIGKLEVARTDDGTLAEEPTTGEKFLQLPVDDNLNKVADQWERDENVFSRGLKETSDVDDLPAALAHHPGDGLGLWEEYRGFVTYLVGQQPDASKWRRFQPQQLEVFVSPDLKSPDSRYAFERGIPIFARINALALYLVRPEDLRFIGVRTFPSWLNFNTPDEMDPKHHTAVGDGHPVAVAVPFSDDVGRLPKKVDFRDEGGPHCVFGTTAEVPGLTTGNQLPRAPIDVLAIGLYPFNGAMCAARYAVRGKYEFGDAGKVWLANRGYSVESFAAKVAGNEAAAKRQGMVQAVIHEFSHAFGLHHHYETGGPDMGLRFKSGALACPTRYTDEARWDYAFWSGEWLPERGAWRPPSFAKKPLVIINDEDSADFMRDLVADLKAKPGDWTVPWETCSRCQKMMHLWAADGDQFPDLPK